MENTVASSSMHPTRGTASIATAAAATPGASAILFSGVGSATPIDSTIPTDSTPSVQVASEATGRVPTLSCEVVAALDRQSAERAATSGVPIPGPEQWPPIALGMDPDEPRPAVAPLDPTTGIPKDQLGGTIPAHVVEEIRAREHTEAQLTPKEPRRCGATVDALRIEAENSTGRTACYLVDGRYAATLFVDFAPTDPNNPTDQRPSRDSFDELCRHLGWDRSYQ